MEKERKFSFFRKNADVLILVLVTAACSALAAVQAFPRLEYRLYDMLLSFTGQPSQNERVLLVEIDDDSIEYIGTWPWTRDVLGNALIRMRELGAAAAVFDIEYLEKGARAVADDAEAQTVQAAFQAESMIAGALKDIGQAASDGSLGRSQVAGALDDAVRGVVDPAIGDIVQVARDALDRNNDQIFAQDAQLFGNAWLTLNMRNVHSEPDPEAVQYAYERFLRSNVTDTDGRIARGNAQSLREEGSDAISLVPALGTIIDHAAGSGFTNVCVDSDGTRRRIELLSQYDGKYAAQLAFSPLLSLLGVSDMERTASALVLHGASTGGDITIPLDKDGRMLINWLHGEYADGFRHESVMFLRQLDVMEDNIVHNTGIAVNVLSRAAPGSLLCGMAQAVLDSHAAAQDVLASMLAECSGFYADGTPRGSAPGDADWERYLSLKKGFYGAVQSLASQAPFSELETLGATASLAANALLAVSDEYEVLGLYLDEMREAYRDSVCFIGFTAVASTDFGVTPFARSYANLGTHANVFNTIAQGDFIRPLSVWWGIAVAFATSLAVVLLCRRVKSAGAKSALSLVYVVLPVLAIVLLMVLAKAYIPLLFPLLLVTVAYIALFALRFAGVVKQGTFLRNTFGAYVAPEVVSQIIRNPELASLGGSDRDMTALFSDVKSFSKFSEMVNDPVRLVQILNEYLGDLSDAIMDNRGTIDKYVGDEIVSFFGAPLDNPRHAYDALVAGIRMKQAEAEYNKKHFYADHDIPFALESRVGVNTGSMVVGNMGTQKKLNYTIMGNNVNLASRLEGVNKAYGTWIICSDASWQEASRADVDDAHKLVARRLDMVRVININTPVPIYSIVGLAGELSAAQVESAGIFNRATERYLARDFAAAKQLYLEALRCHADDVSSKVFADRCERYLATGVPPDWDGVYTMESK